LKLIFDSLFRCCPQEPFDLDELLPSIGEFGYYQKLLLWFICLPAFPAVSVLLIKFLWLVSI
jgi:hypothetical protein